MAPGKRRPWKSPAVTLPAEVLLEIVARSEPGTVVRCTATCKPLRGEILHPSFLRRVCNKEDGAGIILAYLHYRKQEKIVTLIHPATPAASSLMERSLVPYVLRCAGRIHRSYEPLMSRGGLILFRRPHNRASIIGGMADRFCYDLCVFNPMTGDRTYLSCMSGFYHDRFILLTAADGIGCSFRLLATNVVACNWSGGFSITVRDTEADGTTWGPVTQHTHRFSAFTALQHQREPVVLHGGIVHWLLSHGEQVLTYDVRAKRLGTVKLPTTNYIGSQRLLAISPDGTRLRFLGVERCTVSMWVHRPDGWAKEAVINVEHKVRSLHPIISSLGPMSIEFKSWAERSGVLLVQACRNNQMVNLCSVIVLDLETDEMRKIDSSDTSLVFQLDLSARLQAMKMY